MICITNDNATSNGNMHNNVMRKNVWKKRRKTEKEEDDEKIVTIEKKEKKLNMKKN